MACISHACPLLEPGSEGQITRGCLASFLLLRAVSEWSEALRVPAAKIRRWPPHPLSCEQQSTDGEWSDRVCVTYHKRSSGRSTPTAWSTQRPSNTKGATVCLTVRLTFSFRAAFFSPGDRGRMLDMQVSCSLLAYMDTRCGRSGARPTVRPFSGIWRECRSNRPSPTPPTGPSVPRLDVSHVD